MKYATAFRDQAPSPRPDLTASTLTLTPPSEWTARWNTDNGGAVLLGHAVDEQPRLEMLGGPSSGWEAATWDLLDGDADRDDVEVLVLVAPRGHGASLALPVVVVRQSGAAGTESGYLAELLPATGQLRISKLVAGSYTALVTVTPTGRVAVGEPVFVRFRVNGDDLEASAWGERDSEPGSPDATATDSAITAAGGVGLAARATSDHFSVWFFAVGTAGDVAPAFESFGASLAELCRDRDAIFEYTLEMEGRDIGTDVVAAEFHSTHQRDTTAQDLPASQSFTALLEVPQSITNVLAADFDHGQELGQVARLTLKNEPRGSGEPGPLDHWLDGKTFAGRRAILRVGEPGATHRSFTRLLTGTVRGEPEIGADVATVTVESALGLALRRPLDVRRYFGIRTCLRSLSTSGNQGMVTVPSDTAYDTASFSWFARFRSPTYTGSGIVLADRYTDGNNQQFDARMLNGGAIQFRSLDGGVAAFDFTSPLEYDDDRWHWAFGAVLDGVHAYFLVDGVLVGEAVPGTIHTATGQPIRIREGAAVVGFAECEVRFYSHYLTPEVARSQGDQLVDSTLDGLVGHWRLDDGSGTTANDYSPTNNDGSISGGTAGVHWEWAPTDQGDTAFRGRAMPALYGEPYNVPTDPIDKPRERYRFNDGDPSDSTDPDPVRSQGVARVLNTDYTDEGDGVVEFSGAQAEPVTAELVHDLAIGSTTLPFYVGGIVESILLERFGFAATDLDGWAAHALKWTLPYRSGWHSRGLVPTCAAVLQEILGGVGGSYFGDRFGRLVPAFLLPPLGPGPDGTAWPEFTGLPWSSLRWTMSTTASGSHTLACWVQPMKGDLDNAAGELFGASPTITLLGFGDASSAVAQSILALDVERQRLSYQTIGTSPAVLEAVPSLAWGEPFFVAATYDSGTNTKRVYLAPKGGSLVEVASGVVTGSVGNGQVFRVGAVSPATSLSFVGGLQHAQLWPTALSLGSLQALMDAHPEAGDGFTAYAPLSEGTGDAFELASGGACRLHGCRWSPRLTLDLTAGNTGVAWSQSLRQLKPAARVVVDHGRNWRPLAPTEIAPSVAAADRSALLRESRSVSFYDDEVADDYLAARPVTFRSILNRPEDAVRLGVMLRARLAAGRKFGQLRLPDNRALALQHGDEVRVLDHRFGLASGWHARVVGLQAGAGAVSLGLWG